MKKRMSVTHDDLFHHMAKMIGERKRVVLAVQGSKKEPAFFYTIGNQEKQLPELLVIGNFNPDEVTLVLNTLSDTMLQRLNAFGNYDAFKNEELVSLDGKYPLLIYSANEEAKEKYTIQAGQFYNNEDYKVMQVLLPDNKGCYPPDPKCHKDFQVPVLRLTKKEATTI